MMEQLAAPQRIVVLNTKGGSGKTTIATNLAAYYAQAGRRVALMDLDPQGSSMRWLRQRPAEAPSIYGIAGYEKRLNVTRSFALRSPPGTEHVIVDTPAALAVTQMPETVRDAGAIIVPVLPSDIDIHAASRCIADLLLVAKVHRSERRLVIVANRARRYTKAFQSLVRFLQSLHIPVAAVLRDSQAYIRSAETGLGLHEMKGALLQDDLDSWQPLVDWLERRSGSLLPETVEPAPDTAQAAQAPVAPAAATAISRLY
jgi:chromosome partitioning protein